LTQKII